MKVNRRHFLLEAALGGVALGGAGYIASVVAPRPPFLRKAPKIERYGEVSDEFVSRLEEELNKLPPEVLDIMETYGATIVACPMITDYRTNLVGQFIDNIQGMTYDNVVGLQYAKTVLVAEKYEDPEEGIFKTPNPERILRHEVGHYMDISGRILRLSYTPSFNNAYNKDLNIINNSGFSSNRRYMLSEYMTGTFTAKGELFAEVFASMTGSGARVRGDEFPNVRNYIKDEIGFEPISSPEPAYEVLSLNAPPNYWFCATSGLTTSLRNASVESF